MLRQSVYIPYYDWHIVIFYGNKMKRMREILNVLYDVGCHKPILNEIQHFLLRGRLNEGFTYTNPETRASVIVIGTANSFWEIINTALHETDHLVDNISKYYGIPLDSEENARLHGEIPMYVLKDAASKFEGVFSDFLKSFVSQ